MLIVTNWKALNIDINDSSMYEVKNGHLEGLFDVDAFGFDKEDLKQLKDGIVPQAVYRQILDAVSSGFDDNATDPESYLYTSDFDVDQFTLGFKDPDKLIAEVDRILPDIKRGLVNSLSKVYTPGMDPAGLKEDTLDTYDLQKAARALDNSWHSYSEWGTYLENGCGYAYFSVFPGPGQMRDIHERPEDYILVEVYVK